jgi:hypothetical protein
MCGQHQRQRRTTVTTLYYSIRKFFLYWFSNKPYNQIGSPSDNARTRQAQEVYAGYCSYDCQGYDDGDHSHCPDHWCYNGDEDYGDEELGLTESELNDEYDAMIRREWIDSQNTYQKGN